MPYIWGEFETSLRGSKVNSEDVKKILHKTCSGHAHGHGVAKVAGFSLFLKSASTQNLVFVQTFVYH